MKFLLKSLLLDLLKSTIIAVWFYSFKIGKPINITMGSCFYEH